MKCWRILPRILCSVYIHYNEFSEKSVVRSTQMNIWLFYSWEWYGTRKCSIAIACSVKHKAQGKLYLYLFNFALGYIVRKFQENQKELELCRAHQFLLCADDINTHRLTSYIGRKRRFPQKCLNSLLDASKYQIDVFWVVTPCRVVIGYQGFGGPRSWW